MYSSILYLIDYLILFVLVAISISWLLESNFSILLSFILIYLLIGIILIMLGFEFLGILLLLLYSTGIAVVFIIISMSLGTQHNYALKSESIQEEEFYNDKYITDRNNIVYTLMYYLFIVSTFFIIDFFFDSSFNFLGILSSNSFAGILSVRYLTNLNDILLIGIFVFQQCYLHTTLIGILLLVSLISSICVSE